MSTEYKMNLNLLEIKEDKIIFNDIFNEPISNLSNVLSLRKTIVFGKDFNQSLSTLPSNVEKIYLGKNFQKSIIDLPSNINSIIFANDNIFYGSLDYLHDNVQELILSDNYNEIINRLPGSLKTLILGKSYSYKINEFPSCLIYLDIGDNYTDSLDNLPKSLETLIVGGRFNNFIKYPETLKYLIIKENSSLATTFDNLPNSLIYFSLQNNYNLPISKLSDSIMCLSLGKYYNGNILNFPSKLKKIILSNGFEYDFKMLPDSVEIMELNKNYRYLDFLIYKFPKVKVVIK